MTAAVALATILTSCSGGSDADAGSEDSKSGGSTSSAPVAEPGKFDSLPEPCGLPGRSTLRSLLPTDGTRETRAEADKVYRGQADITFDTDRRVGCRWQRETSEGSRHLTIDLQRIVSYDGATSDDDKAQELYAKKQLAAHIPSDTAKTPPVRTPSPSTSKGADGKQGKGQEKGQQDEESGTEQEQGNGGSGAADERGDRPDGGKGAAADPSGGASGGADGNSGASQGKAGETAGKAAGKGSGDATHRPSGTRTAEGDASGSAGSAGSSGSSDDPSGTADPSDSSGSPDDAASLAPRPLSDLGDAAFLNDALVTADSGLHRDITVVFRSSNVIVTIGYDQWSTDKSVLPDRRELQEKAQELAAELAAHWTE